MARMVWVAVLLTATLALGGCAGLPYGALADALGGGYGGVVVTVATVAAMAVTAAAMAAEDAPSPILLMGSS